MSNLCAIDYRFRSKLYELDHHRASPTKNRKEPSMKKLNLEHVEALTIAKNISQEKADLATHPRCRQTIERQIELLNEVKWWILNFIYNPGLPLGDEQPHGTFKLRDQPEDDGTVAKKD